MRNAKFLTSIAIFVALFASCGNSTGGEGTSYEGLLPVYNSSDASNVEIQTYEEVDIIKFSQLKTLKGHSSFVTSVCWSPNGKYFASGSRDCKGAAIERKNGRTKQSGTIEKEN